MGVSGVDLDFSAINKKIHSIPIAENDFITILAKDGLILYHNNKNIWQKT